MSMARLLGMLKHMGLNMKLVKITIVAITLLISTQTFAYSDNRAEIIEHYIDVCFTELVKSYGLTKNMEPHEALALIKVFLYEDINEKIDSASQLVSGKSYQKRMDMYRLMAKGCIFVYGPDY